jgi:ATP/maltotriose-dependent transcriptional regulator MalT
MGESGRALSYLNQSMAINRQIGAQKEILFNLENIADTCICLGKYNRAEEVSAEGLAMARRLGDIPHLGVFSTFLAQINTERGLYGSALEFLGKSMEVSEQITDKPFTVRTLLVLAENYLLMNAPEKAEEQLDRARKICSPIEYDDLLIRLKILTVNVRHSLEEDPEPLLKTLDNIDKESEQRHYRREQCESLLLRLDILAQHGKTSEYALEKLDDMTNLDQFAAFRGFLYYYLGIAGYQDRAYGEALSHFERASVVAKASEQRELLLKAHLSAGRVHMAKLEYEDAFMRLKKAGAILKEIAGNIGDDALARSYMSSADKLEIFDTVKRLTAKLA